MRDFFITCKIILSKKLYLIIVIIVSFVLLIMNAVLINKGSINFVINADYLNWAMKLKIVFNALLNTFAFLSKAEIIFLFIFIFLAGINIAILSFFINNKIKKGIDSGLSIIGIISGFLGIGCASCGLIFISSIVGFSTATSLLAFLPLSGIEFYILGFILISLSILLISKKIQNPLLCKISNKNVS